MYTHTRGKDHSSWFGDSSYPYHGFPPFFGNREKKEIVNPFMWLHQLWIVLDFRKKVGPFKPELWEVFSLQAAVALLIIGFFVITNVQFRVFRLSSFFSSADCRENSVGFSPPRTTVNKARNSRPGPPHLFGEWTDLPWFFFRRWTEKSVAFGTAFTGAWESGKRKRNWKEKEEGIRQGILEGKNQTCGFVQLWLAKKYTHRQKINTN